MQVSTCWTEESTVLDSLRILKTLAMRHARLSGPHKDTLISYLRNNDYESLLSFSIDYADDCQPLHLYHCRQVLALFSKLEFLDVGVDKDAVAIKKFEEAEKSNLEVNRQFRMRTAGSFSFLPRVERLLELSRRKIRRILGRCPDFSELNMKFGPGATTALRKTESNATEKLASGFQCSGSMIASGRLPDILREVPMWADAHGRYSIDEEGWLVQTVPVVITAGKLATVPKTALSSRTIMVEPNLNGFVQQGIRQFMEKRLLRFGLDVGNQQRNKLMAKRSSIDGSLCTLDLSSASDTISYELVKFLLPDEWFRLLCSARTGCVEYGGTEHTLEMFSSMGNGFTFPLETLIFWSIIDSCHVLSDSSAYPPDDVGVYGDDIILPIRGYHDALKALGLCGFTVNQKKSFGTGSFRESCGGDYFKGFDIRPYYQKHLVSAMSLFTLHNYYYRHNDDDGCALVLTFIPSELRLFGPDGYGDGHLLSDNKGLMISRKLLTKGYGGKLFDTFTLKARKKISRFPGDYVSPLYSIYLKDRVRAHDLIDVYYTTPIEFAKSGRPLWPVPSSEGYKRISIYTLAV